MKYLVMIAVVCGVCGLSAEASAQVYGGFSVSGSSLGAEDDPPDSGAQVGGKIGGQFGSAGLYFYANGSAYSSDDITVKAPTAGIGFEYVHPGGSVGAFVGRTTVSVEDHEIGSGPELGVQGMIRFSEGSPVGIKFEWSTATIETDVLVGAYTGVESLDLNRVSLGLAFEWGAR